MYMLRVAHLVIVAVIATSVAFASERPDPSRWDRAMEPFATQDREQRAAPGAILFTGSSSIVFWKLAESFPDLTTLNRGFGGSVYSDLVHHVDRVVAPYDPKAIVVYSGDNDIEMGLTPEEVLEDAEAFVEKVREAYPETPLVIMSIKPSLARWEKWPEMERANAMLREWAEREPHMSYFDTAPLLLGKDGKPRADLLLRDKLHLNEAGYAIWTRYMREHLEELGLIDAERAAALEHGGAALE